MGARAGSVESEAAPVAAQHPEQGIRRLALTRAGVITAKLSQVVGNVVEQRLSGPPVDNFDGYVGISITDLTRDALLPQDGRVFAAAPGSSCRLRMWIATGKEESPLVEPISLRGGDKPAVVEFGALPNLHGVVMTPLEARLRLNTRRGLDRAEFAFTAPEQPRRYSGFIEVSQRTKSVLLIPSN